MASNIRLSPRGKKELLKSAGVRAEVARVARVIAERAGEGFEVRTPRSQPNRARMAVVATTAKAMRGEAKDGRLSRAVGGGRV